MMLLPVIPDDLFDKLTTHVMQGGGDGDKSTRKRRKKIKT
jgi:hypothetical protein